MNLIKTGIKLDKWQEEFIRTKGDKILCTGRQVGKSVICGIDAAEYAISNPKSQPILMIAPTERQAHALFEKTLDHLVKYYKNYIKMGKFRPTKTKIELKSGLKIHCLPTGLAGLGIRFLTVGRLYVDEASRVPEDVWSAVNPMLLTTGGDSIFLSTPAGAQGEFHRCWINKDKAYKSFTRFSINSEDVIRKRPICDTWKSIQREKGLIKIEQAKARMSKKEFAQEYLGKFIDDLFHFFIDKVIADACILKRPERVQIEKRYFMGVDIARMGEDEGTIEILDKIDNEHINHVENYITRKKLTTETFDNIVNANRIYNCKKIGIDAGSGSLGVGILDFLLREPTVKKKVVALNNFQRLLDHRGERKRTLLKEDMYINMLAMMEKGTLKLLDDDEVVASLKSIQYEYVYKKGQPTTVRIFGNYSHVVEGLIRAAWLANTKSLNTFISYI